MNKISSRRRARWMVVAALMTPVILVAAPVDADGPQFPVTASCYSCHATNAAVENTFTQFYPVLRDVAKQKGTFKKVPEVF